MYRHDCSHLLHCTIIASSNLGKNCKKQHILEITSTCRRHLKQYPHMNKYIVTKYGIIVVYRYNIKLGRIQ